MKWTTRIAFRLLPSFVWSQIRLEWSLARRRWFNRRGAARRLLAGQRGLHLHLGCGDRTVPRWLNIDAFERKGLDLRWDLRDPLPCDEGIAELVYSEHFLEHLDRTDAEAFLSEVFRLLRSDGILRLGVPDAELYLRAYAEGRAEFFAGLRHLGGAVEPLTTPVEVINQMFRMGGHHRYAWDFETLTQALRRAGFANVTRWAPGQASRAELCLDDPEHAVETLYVEATKIADRSTA